MVTLVIGGSGSGKSAYAENLLRDYWGAKYYVATMEVLGEEGNKKVERHRSMRRGKGFTTIEQPREIYRVKSQIKERPCGILLECVSNLVANEMFSGQDRCSVEETFAKVVPEIKSLAQNVDQFVIVTNNIFEDGIPYDETTRQYIHAMGDINVALADYSDCVVEVLMGIPNILKGEGVGL